MTPKHINDFWFTDIPEKSWWVKDPEFDRSIRERFGAVHAAAACGELWQWRESALGRLAEVIILDQFSRNIYRDEPGAFACDPMALALAQEAVAANVDNALDSDQRSFLYMPYMHSESWVIHAQAVALFSAPGLEKSLAFEDKHKRIIERFGRYPHRNAVVGRPSTDDEQVFLSEPGSSF